MNKSMLQHIINSKKEGKKLLAVLLDPDKVKLDEVESLIQKIKNKADFIFVGGSTVTNGDTQKLVEQLKIFTTIPIVLFPGDTSQITDVADAILFLSLISGDNPEYLIKQQLKSVIALQKTALEIIPTGYILIDGGVETAVQRVSGTKPILQDNVELIRQTAIAGMYLGKQLIYLEAGSGATEAVSQKIIKKVAEKISIPLIVGGGIRTKKQIDDAYNAGADLIVIGTAFEENNLFFNEI
jgi:putative glycerol-1-phosphate prenyltransferase